MPTRKFIEIDEEKCNGCGNCIIACAEGALAIFDGKAKVVSDNLCDGLGACIGHCPQNALTIVEKDVVAFDKHAVTEHLREIKAEPVPCCPSMSFGAASQCPSAAAGGSKPADAVENSDAAAIPASNSALTHWPIQLGLVNPAAEYFKGKRLLLAADCSAFAYGAFHRDFLSGAAVVIACPKLDNAHERYIAKLAAIIKSAGTGMVEVIRMEVPCCGALTHIAREAIKAAGTPCHVRETIIGVQGQPR